MRISSISVTPFNIPYHSPFVMASGVLTEASHVLIEVFTDEGISGVAEASSRPMIYGESQSSILTAIKQWFEPAIVGLSPYATGVIWERISRVAANNTAKGALDIALHDLRGKASCTSTWKLLGGTSPEVRVTRMLSLSSPQETAEEVCEAIEMFGITSFKVKVDHHVQASLKTVAAVREAAGVEAHIYVDGNQSMKPVEALSLARGLKELGIELFEEPIGATDFRGRNRLTAHGIIVAADESGPDVQTALLQLREGGCTAAIVKPARTGYTETMRISAVAHALGARVLVGSQSDSAVGTITSATFAGGLVETAGEPAELDFFTRLTDQVTVEPPSIKQGRIHVNTEASGNGVTIDQEKLEFYSR
ncbi:mandelate racemase/muconate lactonizing enzyme family protein [Nesterenkonia ebinurensis]|uniref:mandelate racemase/muconate lactonizing enzyme family protein n=1 Tax=Nesterenkonia ebinurensis TaxID=2608252 RepID=UPI00123E4395|nr:enolase C-terminal domain-like protein [Nesterenkonia ebinurensis]